MEQNNISPHYFFIELIAYFEGKIKVSHLQQQFGLSRQQASKHLNGYEAHYPGEPFIKETGNRRFIASDFKPLYINGHVDQYLNWLHSGGLAIPIDAHVTVPTHKPPVPSRNIQPEIIRALMQAIQNNERLDVEYLSLNRPENEGRIISPHSLVKTNMRYHVRAYDEERNRFADFNLSRFRGIPELMGKSEKSQQDDLAWNTQIHLILKPDERLSPEKRVLIEKDYEMQNGELRLQTRACLATYLLQELRVSPKFVDVMPEAQQLVLVNREAVKRWLFDV